MIYDPAWIEKDRQRPISPIPYASQHNTFKCTACGGFFNRKLRLLDGKLNVCPSCKDAKLARAHKSVEVQ